MTFRKLLRELAAFLEARGICAAAVGGCVLPAYGVERLTLDLDLMLAEEDLPDLRDFLEEQGYRMVLRTPQYARFRHDAGPLLDVDTIFVSPETAARIAAGAMVHEVMDVPFPCASLGILLGSKIHAIRYNEANRGDRDFGDLVALLRANDLGPDDPGVARMVQTYGTAAIDTRLREALADA